MSSPHGQADIKSSLYSVKELVNRLHGSEGEPNPIMIDIEHEKIWLETCLK